jgi:hypothetical protein
VLFAKSSAVLGDLNAFSMLRGKGSVCGLSLSTISLLVSQQIKMTGRRRVSRFFAAFTRVKLGISLVLLQQQSQSHSATRDASIRDVWASNLEEEIAIIRDMMKIYPYVSIVQWKMKLMHLCKLT